MTAPLRVAPSEIERRLNALRLRAQTLAELAPTRPDLVLKMLPPLECAFAQIRVDAHATPPSGPTTHQTAIRSLLGDTAEALQRCHARLSTPTSSSHETRP